MANKYSWGDGFNSFDTKAIGGAINQGIADYKKGKALDAAKDEKFKSMQALDEQFKNGVDGKEMTQEQYAAKRQAINDTYNNAAGQADIDYYSFRGNDEKREAAEAKLKNAQWAQGMMSFHDKAMQGDPDALRRLVGFSNTQLNDGSRYELADNGTLTQYGADGSVLNAGIKVSPQMVNDSFRNFAMYEKFRKDADFDGYFAGSLALEKNQRDRRALDHSIMDSDRTYEYNKENDQKNRDLKSEIARGEQALGEAKFIGGTTKTSSTSSSSGSSSKSPFKWNFERGVGDVESEYLSGPDGQHIAYKSEDGAIVPAIVSPQAAEWKASQEKNGAKVQVFYDPKTGTGTYGVVGEDGSVVTPDGRTIRGDAIKQEMRSYTGAGASAGLTPSERLAILRERRAANNYGSGNASRSRQAIQPQMQTESSAKAEQPQQKRALDVEPPVVKTSSRPVTNVQPEKKPAAESTAAPAREEVKKEQAKPAQPAPVKKEPQVDHSKKREAIRAQVERARAYAEDDSAPTNDNVDPEEAQIRSEPAKQSRSQEKIGRDFRSLPERWMKNTGSHLVEGADKAASSAGNAVRSFGKGAREAIAGAKRGTANMSNDRTPLADAYAVAGKAAKAATNLEPTKQSVRSAMGSANNKAKSAIEGARNLGKKAKEAGEAIKESVASPWMKHTGEPLKNAIGKTADKLANKAMEIVGKEKKELPLAKKAAKQLLKDGLNDLKGKKRSVPKNVKVDSEAVKNALKVYVHAEKQPTREMSSLLKVLGIDPVKKYAIKGAYGDAGGDGKLEEAKAILASERGREILKQTFDFEEDE